MNKRIHKKSLKLKKFLNIKEFVQKTNIPKTINIRDITQATTGLLILTSVIYI